MLIEYRPRVTLFIIWLTGIGLQWYRTVESKLVLWCCEGAMLPTLQQSCGIPKELMKGICCFISSVFGIWCCLVYWRSSPTKLGSWVTASKVAIKRKVCCALTVQLKRNCVRVIPQRSGKIDSLVAAIIRKGSRIES